jgi:hypothetical protein
MPKSFAGLRPVRRRRTGAQVQMVSGLAHRGFFFSFGTVLYAALQSCDTAQETLVILAGTSVACFLQVRPSSPERETANEGHRGGLDRE